MGSFKQSTSQDEVRGRLRTGDPPGKRRSRERQTPNDLSGTSPVPAAGLDNGFCGTKKRRPVDPVVAMSLARGVSAAVEAWAASQPDQPTRFEAICRLVAIGPRAKR
jgi:hypothetical protein